MHEIRAYSFTGVLSVLGSRVFKNLSKFEETKVLVEKGDAAAQHNLGVMYADGEGVPQNFREAVKWYRGAADQGFAPAQNNLGQMYEAGNGVSKDFEEAVKWYRKAAEQGDEQGQYNLGVMYHLGHGVLKNDVTTITWWNIAAANGHEIANENKGVVTKDMTPDQIDEPKNSSSR